MAAVSASAVVAAAISSGRRSRPPPPPAATTSSLASPPAGSCGALPTTSAEISGAVGKRTFCLSALTVPLLSGGAAGAATTGGELREHIDNFDGYTFLYPKSWIPVRGAGADVFFRDPYVLDENVSVEISSPSSSRYAAVDDLGPPEAAAERVLRHYLTELMSTRLGVRRESNILSSSSRVADDGKKYYQVEVNIRSFASSNQLAVMPEERVQKLEWDRRYLSVLGVENRRLYELRLQSPEKVFGEEEAELRAVMESFRVFKSID